MAPLACGGGGGSCRRLRGDKFNIASPLQPFRLLPSKAGEGKMSFVIGKIFYVQLQKIPR
ncbi:hypothetical protein CGSHi3655_04095 [Haemophilus influenzae 3655]|uniref:Uncharacterized protein n=1 Tax=Haemophilus influenzae (strain NTHi 3655) TaxID=375177 RepID=A0A0H3PGH6_HAEI3|nr:hypothetical protein CGSHi3655_04095 [Haemophilus influenzae 3655]